MGTEDFFKSGAVGATGGEADGADGGKTAGASGNNISSATTPGVTLEISAGKARAATGYGADTKVGTNIAKPVSATPTAQIPKTRSSSGRAHAPQRLRLVEERTPAREDAGRTDARALNRTWLSVDRAARIVDMHPTSFRRQLEKNVYRADDGGTESRFDGIFARKLGGRWKVLLGPRWLNPLSAEGENNDGVRVTSSSARPEHTGRSGK